MKYFKETFICFCLLISNSALAQVISSTTTQVGNPVVFPNTINAPFLRIEMVTGPAPITITNMYFNNNGSDNAPSDLENAKLWFSGVTPTFTTVTATLLDTWVPFGASPWATNYVFLTNQGINNLGLTSFNGLIPGQTNYFWLTYNIKPTATVCNYVDAEFLQVTADSVVILPLISNPAGSSQIGLCSTGIPEHETPTLLSVFPVPSGNQITLTFTQQIVAPVLIELFDINGKLIEKVYNDLPKNKTNQIELLLPELNSGIYLLQTIFEDKVLVNKIIIL